MQEVRVEPWLPDAPYRALLNKAGRAAMVR